MKKLLPATISFFLVMATSYGQQAENPGFEDWEDAGTVIDEPVNWSSIKTSDAGGIINNAAPVVWGQSTDAHSGNYSLELENVLTIGSIIATGTITNGRLHADFNPSLAFSYTDPNDSRWHTPFTSRPDSIAVWVKYFPQGTDTAQVKVLLHVGEGTLPPTTGNQGNRVGYAQINVHETLENWTRVVVPFTYSNQANPEYMLIILTAGAGLGPTQGSIVRYDDVLFIYDPSSIFDRSPGNSLVYSHRKDIFLNRLPDGFRNNSKLELYNLNGTLVSSQNISSHLVSFGGTGIPSGVYLIRIVGEEGSYAQKIQLW